MFNLFNNFVTKNRTSQVFIELMGLTKERTPGNNPGR